jgi:hypothetical protein
VGTLTMVIRGSDRIRHEANETRVAAEEPLACSVRPRVRLKRHRGPDMGVSVRSRLCHSVKPLEALVSWIILWIGSTTYKTTISRMIYYYCAL